MVQLIPLAISLATKFAPMLVDRLAGPKAGEVAEKVINIAQNVSGKADPQDAHDAIMNAPPEVQLEFERSANNLEVEIAGEQTKELIAINETMRDELKADGIKGFWRPYNGVLFGTTLFVDHLIMRFVVLFINVYWANIDACKNFKWENIPFPVYVFWALVLGVNGYTRGQEKLEKIKRNGESLGMAEMLKTFGLGALGI